MALLGYETSPKIAAILDLTQNSNLSKIVETEKNCRNNFKI